MSVGRLDSSGNLYFRLTVQNLVSFNSRPEKRSALTGFLLQTNPRKNFTVVTHILYFGMISNDMIYLNEFARAKVQ